MKKVVYNIGFIILGMCFALQSCSDIIHEEPNPVPPEGDELVPISLDFEGLTSVDTYGTD